MPQPKTDPAPTPTLHPSLETPKGLYAKLAWVQAKVDHVEKTGHVEHGNVSYNHMQEHGLLSVIKPLCAAQGLALMPGVEGFQIDGNTYVIDLALTIVDAESGESVTRRFPNVGVDRSDKGFNKAYTGAFKYALQKFFAIPTERIDDNETTEEPAARSAPIASTESVEIAELRALVKASLDQKLVTRQDIKTRLQALGATQIAALSAADASAMLDWLNEKAAA